MRGQKEEEEEKNRDGTRKAKTEEGWKLLDQVSSWTSFSFSLPLKLPPHGAEAKYLSSLRPRTNRAPDTYKQTTRNGILNYPDKEHNIYLELYFKETAKSVFHRNIGPCSAPSPQGEQPLPSSILLFVIMPTTLMI